MKTDASLTVKPLTGILGAEVAGLDLRQELDEDAIEGLRRLLNDHLVVFFRDQDITPERQVAFASRFGAIMEPYADLADSPSPGLGVLDHLSGNDATGEWHTDSTFEEKPPMLGMLWAKQVPPIGGDTAWSSMYAAYESLSSTLRAFLDGLTAVHSIESVLRRIEGKRTTVRREVPPHVVHPVVRTHPETGRNALFVCPSTTMRIVELDEGESNAVLRFLFEHLRSPHLQCRFRWQVNSVALWDERVTQHCAIADYSARRIMYRCMVRGDRPYGPAMPALENDR
jgi:taurine dioxygenase